MGIGLVLGFFDGVHKAHRAVIESALNSSDKVVLITFKDSPSLFFANNAEYILPRYASIKKIKDLGVHEVIELDFPKIAQMTSEQYLEYLIQTYHPVSISTGFNHTFGLNKTGNSEMLNLNSGKYNYKYICIQPVKINNKIVSSSLIKEYLREGKVEEANSLLESNFFLEGKVVHGAKLGRTIGFPTANIYYPKNIVKLPFGVYQAKLNIDGLEKHAVMNWGMKPTVNNTIEPIVEIHILNYNGDLYEKNIKAEILKYIRGEEKFNSLDELKNQIKKDIELCLM